MTIKELTKARTKLNLSQKGLSRLIKKHETFICKLEHGHRLFTTELQTRIQKTLTKVRKGAR